MWHLNGKSYSRRDFYYLLVNKGQTIAYNKTRKSWKLEFKPSDLYQIYTKGTLLLAVI